MTSPVPSPMQPFAAHVERLLRDAPGQVVVTDGRRRVTRAELVQDARQLGSALRRRGLSAGATVAFQLPNWHEACVIHLAAVLHGWRLVPLLPMYREAELGQMLRECEVDALFLPGEFRGVAYPQLLARVRATLPRLRHAFTLRAPEGGLPRYEDLLAEGAAAALETVQPAPVDAIRMVLFTSGSTGRPKGVVHTHRTVQALIDFAADFWRLTPADVLLVPSPVGHIGGSMYAFELPWVAGCSVVLMESWDPAAAVRLIEAEGASFCAGATPFLEGLLKAAEAAGSALPTLRRFICGGASVPPALVQRATHYLVNCTVSRAYGSTEVPVICPGVRSRDDAAHGASTDGECCADVHLLDEQDHPVPAGQPGDIVVRAPRMFAGYLNPRDNEGAYTADGYFRMGDIGRRVEGRFLEITGRRKDIIIRLGENISPLEIETALLGHAAIRQVSVVGVPDARTGEAAMAFVVLKPEAVFDLAEMRRHLLACGLARQKCPERLRIMDTLPANAIGKVLKAELRRLADDTPTGA